jgi:hypothetical protein
VAFLEGAAIGAISVIQSSLERGVHVDIVDDVRPPARPLLVSHAKVSISISIYIYTLLSWTGRMHGTGACDKRWSFE